MIDEHDDHDQTPIEIHGLETRSQSSRAGGDLSNRGGNRRGGRWFGSGSEIGSDGVRDSHDLSPRFTGPTDDPVLVITCLPFQTGMRRKSYGPPARSRRVFSNR